MKDEMPEQIWSVQDYYQAKEFYDRRGLVFNPALERGSPAAAHVINQHVLKSNTTRRVMKDFFVSYNSKDKPWAEWIAWTLEEAGYSTVIQSWDFRPGTNFVLEMQSAAAGTARTIAVLSENYLSSKFTQSEWAAAFARDPEGKERRLIPFRVGECSPTALLGQTIYVDLVGLSEEDARITLLGAFSERGKPKEQPRFPGDSGTPPTESAMPPTSPRKEYPGNQHVRSVSHGLEIQQTIEVEIVRKKLSPTDRLAIISKMNSIAPQQFNMLVFALNPPSGLIPSMPAPPGDRSHALLAWAEGPGGCGLEIAADVLERILSPS